MSDESFSADWLALREPADRCARDAGLLALLAASLPPAPLLQVVDLGTGSAANLRALAPLLAVRQHWWLLDHDPHLLAALQGRLRSWAEAAGWQWDAHGQTLIGAGREVALQCRHIDLATGLADLPIGSSTSTSTLVTASALLDLVSAEWIAQLVRRCCVVRATLYFSMSYDGRISCDPPLPDDDLLRDLVNRHQQGEKSFGAALGPAAVPALRGLLAQQPYDIHVARSDWLLGADAALLQRELVAGWTDAAVSVAPAATARLNAWRAARFTQISARALRLQVGHLDLLATPRAG
ncbi:MAG: class I SAM-dependent methyltransferase [Steroidobacteraceae bacterium]